MMAMVSMMVFSSALALACAVMWVSIAPQWRRIVMVASGRIEAPFHPLEQLARAERRIAVRRWASAPVPAPLRRLRAA